MAHARFWDQHTRIRRNTSSFTSYWQKRVELDRA
jgi:hypothetical protein